MATKNMNDEKHMAEKREFAERPPKASNGDELGTTEVPDKVQ